MKAIKSIILVVSSLILMSACTEKIDISLDESSSKIVIEGSITNELKEHQVRITRSTGYLDEHPTPEMAGARVVLSDGFNEIQLTEVSTGVFKTIPAMAGICGRTYTLKVYVNEAEYVAQSYLRPVVPLDSIQITKADMPLDPGQVWETGKIYYNLGAFMQEPGDQVNFYMLDACRNGVLVNDTLSKKRFVDDVIINGSYVTGMSAIQVDAVPGDSVTLNMYSVNKDFYQFLFAIYQSAMTGNPFAGTPANVQTNFSGGAYGFFWAGAKSVASGIVGK